jgi:hypothetical protein
VLHGKEVTMLFKFLKRLNANAGLFNGHFAEVKAFYVWKFNEVPCLTFIGDMDTAKVFDFVKDVYKADIISTYQHSYFNHDDKELYFNNTIIVLSFKRMIEITDNHCQLLHTGNQYAWAKSLANELSQFRVENAVPYFKHTHVVGFAKEAAVN